MKMKKYKAAEHGVLTQQMDVGTEDFYKFQAILLNESKAQTASQKTKIELLALKFRMEDYLASEEATIKSSGEFLKSLLKITHIRQNKFAAYIGLQPSNLSKLINGERSISYEMAFIFGSIFDIDPMLWINIQTKNELRKLSLLSKKKYANYSLADLIAS